MAPEGSPWAFPLVAGTAQANSTVDGYKLCVWVNTQLSCEPEPRRIWCASTTNFAVTLPSTPADPGEQRRTVTDAYSQVAGLHE
jgi:hypothetical protein